jgi:N-acetylmuramoyl-L-alanine amidase
LNFVLILIVVAALFATGVWWGMRDHRAAVATALPAPISPSVEASKPPAVTDNLLDSTKLDSDPLQAAPASASKLAAMPKITGVRHWSSQVGSTVVIDMQDQVPYEVHRLASPERIYFDLHDTGLASELEGRTIEVGDTSLKRVRVAQPVSGVTRIVLDTKDGSAFSVSMESSPYRLVVQLRGSERPAAPARTDLTPSTARSQASKTALSPLPLRPEDDQPRAKAGRFRIVLDAGHGGWDLGTVGRQGLLEKDLVLDVTQRLGKLLQSRLAAEVAFTRTNDAYLPLDQRADFANQAQADLFVSVHANYSSLASARGVETYYTNLFSAPGSREIEKQDNGTSARPSLVKLSAGELHEKIEESRRLAASVQRALYAKLAANSPGIRDRGIKDSAFVVLTGTTMPSILTEISFVSSPADEHNLQSAAYRQQIAEALYKGIAHYETGTHRVKMAQVRANAVQQ